MGNQQSSSSSGNGSRRRNPRSPETATERAKKVIGDLNEELKKSVKTLDDDHPAAQLIDHVCGGYFDDDKYGRHSRSASFYSEDVSEDGSRTISEDDTYDDRSRRSKNDKSVESSSYVSQSDYDSDSKRKGRKVSNSFDTEEESKAVSEAEPATLISKPLASSFAKRCYFTKAGIGKTTQHYEGLTLTGNVVLMLAAAMKLKGCPTICDEDLRRVEQTYPNQFSRLPDELLLSSGWRRISKYCHFSNKPIPDGIPFFHSKQRLHPSGGYYFLLAAAVGMVRPLDVEPLTKDTLVLLETDYPGQCDSTPSVLVRDPDQWTLVSKFCFFSGGPINTEEDVYYQADFDGNPIFMLAFLSPSLTPEELYKLKNNEGEEPGLKSIAAVQEVESVYDLTERDFDDLKLYHLGPCRALPQYILQPQAWTKVLPPHFLAARQHAMMRAEDWELRHGPPPAASPQQGSTMVPPDGPEGEYPEESEYPQQVKDAPSPEEAYYEEQAQEGMNHIPPSPPRDYPEEEEHQHQQQQEPDPQVIPKEPSNEFQRQIQEEGAFVDNTAPMDEAFASRYPVSPPGMRTDVVEEEPEPDIEIPETPKLDPPEMENEPPSLTISTEDVPFEQDQQPQAFDDAGERAPFPQNQPQTYFRDAPANFDETEPEPVFSDAGFSGLGLTPEGEPSIGADGFFEDNFYESPQKQENDFGAPYYENEPEPKYDNPSSHPEYENEPPQSHFESPPRDAPRSHYENTAHSHPHYERSPPRDETHSHYDTASHPRPHYETAPPRDESHSHYESVQHPHPHYEKAPLRIDPHYESAPRQHPHHYETASHPHPHYETAQRVPPHYETQPHAPPRFDGMARSHPHYQQPPHARPQYDNASHGNPRYDNPSQPPHYDSVSHSRYDNTSQPHMVPQMSADDEFQDDFDDPISPLGTDYDRPEGHYPMSPPDDNEVYSGAEEKKIGNDDLHDKSGEEDFIPIKHNSFQLSTDGPSPRSMDSIDSRSHQSSALKGAQDILRKNRRRRVEMAMKQSRSDSEPNPAIAQHGGDDASESTWESGSEMTGSMISGSSVWSEGSTGDRSSRRALILQMAKARMKTTRDSVASPEKGDGHSAAPPIEEEEEEEEDFEQDPPDIPLDNTTDIDFPIELD